MSKSEEGNGGMRITSPDEGRKGCLGRFIIVLLVLTVIVLVTICILVRLDGPQSIMESWLTDHMGMEMSIGDARIGLPFMLVLEKPVSADFDVQIKGGFRAREVRIGPGLGLYKNVSVKKGVLILAQKDDDTWEPGEFTRYGNIPMVGLGEISRATSVLRSRMRLHVEDGSIVWVDGTDGRKIASVDGLSFDMQSAGVPGRKMYHYRLSVYRGLHPNGSWVENAEREWLASENIDYIELYRADGKMSSAVMGFWNPEGVRRGDVLP